MEEWRTWWRERAEKTKVCVKIKKSRKEAQCAMSWVWAVKKKRKEKKKKENQKKRGAAGVPFVDFEGSHRPDQRKPGRPARQHGIRGVRTDRRTENDD